MPKLRAEQVEAALRHGGPCKVEADLSVKFKPGDRVVTQVIHEPGHTRLPGYARGRQGTVERHHGAYIYPDSNAKGRGPDPQNLYSVRFEAGTLWGGEPAGRGPVYIDLFEPYLRPGDGTVN